MDLGWAYNCGAGHRRVESLPFIAFDDRGPYWGFKYCRDVSVSVTKVFFPEEDCKWRFFVVGHLVRGDLMI